MGQNALKKTIIPYMGIGHTFLANQAEIFHGPKILFLARRWAWPTRWRQRIWGLKTRPKSWPIGWTFVVNRYLKKRFKKVLQELNTVICKDKQYFNVFDSSS